MASTHSPQSYSIRSNWFDSCTAVGRYPATSLSIPLRRPVHARIVCAFHDAIAFQDRGCEAEVAVGGHRLRRVAHRLERVESRGRETALLVHQRIGQMLVV